MANDTMLLCAKGLEREGFKVGGIELDGSLGKIIGYEIVRHPAALRVPAKRALWLMESLLFLVRQEKVQANVVRIVLGVWIWAALLRRQVLCIPHSFASSALVASISMSTGGRERGKR